MGRWPVSKGLLLRLAPEIIGIYRMSIAARTRAVACSFLYAIGLFTLAASISKTPEHRHRDLTEISRPDTSGS